MMNLMAAYLRGRPPFSPPRLGPMAASSASASALLSEPGAAAMSSAGELLSTLWRALAGDALKQPGVDIAGFLRAWNEKA